jgi:hypothetical protein
MLRATRVSARQLTIYHRNAMPIQRVRAWNGNYGAHGRWNGEIGMSEEVTPRKAIGQIDREMLSYVHQHKIRHDQLVRSYHRTGQSAMRRRWLNREAKFRRHKYLSNAYKTYLQFETMKTLREQAQLVTRYGQAAVNKALGDWESTEQRQQRAALVRRAVRTPPMQAPAPMTVVTRMQHYPDRFTRGYKMN